MPTTLIVYAEAAHKHKQKKGDLRLSEFAERELYRRLDLPALIDLDRVTAEFERGILQITARKKDAPTAEPRLEARVRGSNAEAGVYRVVILLRQLDRSHAVDRGLFNIENRSAAGSTAGTRRRVRFGTGSGRETQHAHRVDEDTGMYRTHSAYPGLMVQTIHGSPGGFAQEGDMLRQGYAIIRAADGEREAKELVEWRERAAPARFSTGLDAILQAAFERRIDRLYIGEGATMTGVYQGRANKSYQNWGSEDLLNLAAVETILQGGEVFATPDGATLAAGFRF